MNVANIRRLARRLRSPSAEGHFDLTNWLEPADDTVPLGQAIHTCGTVACIAGFAAVMAEPTLKDRHLDGLDYSERGQKFLGLTDSQARALFIPDAEKVDYDAVTRFIAADVLDHLADTGEVIWQREVFYDE